MIDWGDDNEFLKRYRLIGATEMAKSYGTHRQAIYNRYNYLTNYKSCLPNGRVIPKEKQFPYLDYLTLLLKEIRKYAESHRMVPKWQHMGLFRDWLTLTLDGQRLLRHFDVAREGGTQKSDYEFGEGA